MSDANLPKPTLREDLAALSHDQWSGWMKYMFGKCELQGDGTATIPADFVRRWQRQMTTPYNNLPQSERESDRSEADRMISVIDLFDADNLES